MSTQNPISFASLFSIIPFIHDAILLRGPHGIGKSAVPAYVAKKNSLRLLDVRLSLFTEGDLIGVPDHERIKTSGVTTFAPPDWLHAACTEPCILFLDEINRATPGVQNSAFQLVLDREVKGMRLHPETLVYAAINDSPEYSVNEMDPALLDRFVTYDLVPTVHDWLTWAEAERIDEVVIEFIRNHPEHLRPTKAVEPGSITPTQRSWARLANTLNKANMNPASFAGSSCPDGFYAISMGYIGVPTAIAFVDFVRNYSMILSAADVVDNFKKNEKKVRALSAEKILGLIEKVANYANEKQDDAFVNNFSDSQLKNIVEFTKLVTDEQLIIFWSKISGAGCNVNNLQKIHKLIVDRIRPALAGANAAKVKKS